MARVSKVKNNFNRIARDLDRAIRLARLSEADAYLLSEARELSWSFAGEDARPFRFNLSAIERISGFDRKGLSRRLRALIDRRFFLDLGDGSLLIEKDYRRWLAADEETPLLDSMRVEWCLSIVRDVPDRGAQSPPPGEPSPRSGPGSPVPTPWGAQSPPPGEPSPQAHIQDRAHRAFYESKKSIKENTQNAGVCTGNDAPKPPSEIAAASVRNDPAEIARVADFAERLFPLLEFGRKVTAFAEGPDAFPVAWIRRALETASAQDCPQWVYVLGILRRFQAEGGPRDPKPRAESGEKPKPASVARREALAEGFRRKQEEERIRMEANDGE